MQNLSEQDAWKDKDIVELM